jgi:prolyl-tRNA synthetase
VKFKDWDLVGVPYRIVCGRGVAEGKVECKPRGGENADLPLTEAAAAAIAWVRAREAELRAAAEATR